MTRAPANLLAVRSLLLTHLDNAPGPDDLDPAEVGIVGDSAHRGGYHCGSDRVVANDYSVVESPRDRAGLTLDAAALDVGQFDVRSGGRTNTLRSFSVWCVAQCAANAADTRDIREIIYSPDGSTVKRWDRLGKRTSGDSSHRWHTHFSFFRDAIKAGRDQRPLFRRYLSSIGLLEDDMTPEEHNWLATVHKNLTVLDGRNPVGQIYTRMAMGEDVTTPNYTPAHPTLKSLAAQVSALQTALTALSNRDFTDEPAIVQGVLASLTPEKIAAAIPPTMAKQVADELARRLVA
ncbi:hypothetical protein O7631_28600 [Micromonospora sp. WMMD967]|uniref:hypothetical protein n=1 Tax=Micromonospora sp. WMMD967 TaxID=3016101 RepID=UPI002416F39E|nr:hypothetical protein [Micromonospora sp. WMMD967]MDG4840505.1 hypothetical protein [Micromonospora sp. WMMD967]